MIPLADDTLLIDRHWCTTVLGTKTQYTIHVLPSLGVWHDGKLWRTAVGPDDIGLCSHLIRLQRLKCEDTDILPARKPVPLRSADAHVDDIPPVHTGRSELLLRSPDPVLFIEVSLSTNHHWEA